jgi:hypothetical protein
MSKDLEARCIEPKTPLRLAVAAKIAFPDGSMTASGLRREMLRGRLEVERIANKDYTTLEAIARMRELCRVQAKGLTSDAAPLVTRMASSTKGQFGSSETAKVSSPQDVLRTRLNSSRQRKSSKP